MRRVLVEISHRHVAKYVVRRHATRVRAVHHAAYWTPCPQHGANVRRRGRTLDDLYQPAALARKAKCTGELLAPAFAHGGLEEQYNIHVDIIPYSPLRAVARLRTNSCPIGYHFNDEIKKQVDDFSGSVKNLVNKDWSKVNDPIAIKNAITEVTSALEKSKSVTSTVKNVAGEITADSVQIKQISNDVQAAIKADTDLINSQLKKITSFNLDTGTQILSNAFYSALYAVCGDYYPYVSQAIDAAIKAKQSSSADAKETQKKAAKTQKRHSRLPGVDVWYKNDNVPRFLIEKISFSGLGVTAQGLEISNDMDKRGKPATLSGSYDEGGKRTHKAKVVVDARSVTDNPLVGAEYSGNNYPLSFESPYLNLASNTTIAATGTMDLTGAVSIGAKLDMRSLALTADPFEPAIAYRFYTSALGAIDRLQLGAQISIDAERNLSLKLDSDLDKQFNTILKNVVNKELAALISEAKAQITAKLGEQTGGVTDQISQFFNFENGINAQSLNMDALNKQLNSKKAELQRQLEKQAAGAIGEQAGDALGGALKKLF